MNFSAERFAEVMSHLDPQMRTQGGRDKRRAPRLSQHADLTIIPYTETGPGKPLTVSLRDFSSRGVRIIHKQLMAHGEEFIVMLPRHGGRPIPMLCAAVHCDQIEDGYSIGAEFVCVTRDEKAAPPAPATNAADIDRIRHSMLD